MANEYGRVEVQAKTYHGRITVEAVDQPTLNGDERAAIQIRHEMPESQRTETLLLTRDEARSLAFWINKITD